MLFTVFCGLMIGGRGGGKKRGFTQHYSHQQTSPIPSSIKTSVRFVPKHLLHSFGAFNSCFGRTKSTEETYLIALQINSFCILVEHENY